MKIIRLVLLLVVTLVLGGVAGYTIPRDRGGQKASPSATQFAQREWRPRTNAVAYVLPNDGPYYDLKWAGVSTTLRTLGYEPQRYSAAAYKNIKAQTDIVDNLVQKGVAGIILHPVSDSAVVPAVERAYEAGIPVIAENVNISSDRIAGRVMLANYEIGWELAMLLVQAIHGEGKIAALVGPPGQEQCNEMWRGACAYFSRYPKVQVVREERLGANSQEALKLTQAILLAHPDLAGIYTWFVQNGIGAAEAVRQAKIPPNRIKVVAMHTDPRGEGLLKEGYLTAILAGDPILLGEASAKLLDGVLKGTAKERDIVLRNHLIDSNLAGVIDRYGFDLSAFQLKAAR